MCGPDASCGKHGRNGWFHWPNSSLFKVNVAQEQSEHRFLISVTGNYKEFSSE